MTDPGDRGSDIYDSSMGDGVSGGSVSIGSNPDGGDHCNTYGDGAHFSWDVNPGGDVTGMHGTLHDEGGNEPW